MNEVCLRVEGEEMVSCCVMKAVPRAPTAPGLIHDLVGSETAEWLENSSQKTYNVHSVRNGRIEALAGFER